MEDLRRARRSGVGGGRVVVGGGAGSVMEVFREEGARVWALGCGRSIRRTVAP